MTKQDYRVFAEWFRESYGLFNNESGQPGESYSEAVGTFADKLEADNPRFDRRTFVDACGAVPFYAGVEA